MTSSDGQPALRSCGNCGHALLGPYCHACGQAAHVHRSLTHLSEELLHGVLHFDTRGLRTLPLLIGRPGLLTRRYIDGQRTRYIAPLVLFLFCMFLLYLTVSLVGSAPSVTSPAQRAAALADVQREVQSADAEVVRASAALAAAERSGRAVAAARGALDSARTDQRVASMTLQTLQVTLPSGRSPSLTQWLAGYAGMHVDTGSARLDAMVRQVLRDPELFFFKLRTEAYKLAFLVVLISLPFLWLLFVGRRDVVLYDHAVFVLYSLSFMALLLIASWLMSRVGLSGAAALALMVVPPLHMFAQLRGTYALSVWAALWRTLALLAVAGTAFLLFAAIVVVLASG